MTSYGVSNPYDLKLMGSIGFLILIITNGFAHMIELRIRRKSWSNFYPNSIFSKSEGFTPGFAIGLIGGLLLFLGQFSLLLGWYYDQSGLSLTYLLLVGIAPMTTVLSFIVYQEKLTIIQLIGMIISLGGVAYLGYGSLDGGWISYICGVASLILFSFRNLSGRSMENKGIDVYTGCMLNAAGEVMCGAILIVWIALYQGFGSLFAVNSDFFICFFGGIVTAYGSYYINQAVMTGNIGVVISIVNASGIVFFILDYIFRDIPPTFQKISSCIVLILGIFVLVFGDNILIILKNEEILIKSENSLPASILSITRV